MNVKKLIEDSGKICLLNCLLDDDTLDLIADDVWRLELLCTEFTPITFQKLKRFKQLRWLTLNDVRVSNISLPPNIKYLKINGTIACNLLNLLPPSLKQLEINGKTVQLSRLKKDRCLNLKKVKFGPDVVVTNHLLRRFKYCPITSLTFYNCNYIDLKYLKNLKFLDINGEQLLPRNLPATLEHLELSGWYILSLDFLNCLPNLRHLCLKKNKIINDDTFKSWPQLESITLPSNCYIRSSQSGPIKISTNRR